MSESVSVTQAADILNVSRQQVLRLVNAGRLDAQKIGNYWVIKRASVEAYKAKRKQSKKA